MAVPDRSCLGIETGGELHLQVSSRLVESPHTTCSPARVVPRSDPTDLAVSGPSAEAVVCRTHATGWPLGVSRRGTADASHADSHPHIRIKDVLGPGYSTILEPVAQSQQYSAKSSQRRPWTQTNCYMLEVQTWL